jgi:arylsulfatase A-like enzyme
MTEKPNVLFLTVDALRADRTTLHGYTRPTTPNLERLAENAIVCENAFSLGPFTQAACVQMMTATRPFSFGGFDVGAIGRPPTVFRRFKDAGYRTVALSTLHWVNRFFGYGDGLDEEWQLFILNTLVGVAVANMRNSIQGYNEKTITEKEMLAVAAPVIAKLFRNAEEYCSIRIRNEAGLAADFPDSLLVGGGYDYGRVRGVVRRHRKAFEEDAMAYIHTHLKGIPLAHEWLARDWYYRRKPGKLLAESWIRGSNLLLEPFAPSLARSRRNRFRSYVDASALADKVISILRRHEKERPFFLWAHFMDTHIPYVSGRGRRWYRETPAYLAKVGHDTGHDPSRTFDPRPPESQAEWAAFSALYDAAVRWTDEQIGRIVEAVDGLGLGEDTIIAVCGDHGEEFGEHGDISHHFLPYEHNIRVPMLFRRRGQAGRRIGDLTCLIDAAPTLARMAGLEPHPDWEGRPLDGPLAAPRDHLVTESFYGGNCIFEDRFLYMGVRTRNRKFFWKEGRDSRDTFSQDGPELYDVLTDPDEQDNIYRPDHPEVPRLESLIAARLAEIPEISPERIARAFGTEVA